MGAPSAWCHTLPALEEIHAEIDVWDRRMDGCHQIAELVMGIVIAWCPTKVVTHVDGDGRPSLRSMGKGRKKDRFQQIVAIKSTLLGILMDHAEPLHTIRGIEFWKMGEDKGAQDTRFEGRKHVKEVLAVVWGWYWIRHLWDVHCGDLVILETKSSERNAPPRYLFLGPTFGIGLFSHENSVKRK
jgi:hypothetical protein